ncbi:hypothetical protein GCM10022419_046200 [Nonomuraea rosea]|uniref:Uncharacterized protein n=1 Tax=Nonomuraea rosea TaxID=638574 RepID=A0ABP6X3C8_9ACTN
MLLEENSGVDVGTVKADVIAGCALAGAAGIDGDGDGDAASPVRAQGFASRNVAIAVRPAMATIHAFVLLKNRLKRSFMVLMLHSLLGGRLMRESPEPDAAGLSTGASAE